MILCIDLETTSLDERAGGLVEIGASWLHSGETFYRECRPLSNALIEDEALQVNGWTRERLQDRKLLPENIAVIEFIGWVRGSHPREGRVQIAAWNAHFEHRHLQAALTRAGVEELHRPFMHRLLDAHSVLAADRIRAKLATPVIDWNLHPDLGGEVRNSDEASKLLKLEPEPKPHNALAGARQVRAMLRRLLGDEGALP